MSTTLTLNDPHKTARQALADEHLLEELLEGVAPSAQKSAIREGCSKALLFLSEHHPRTLLPHWGYFVGLLKSDNGFSKYVAIHVIAQLVSLDDRGRFEKAFNAYYSLLDDESVMVACHVAGASGAIAKLKPHLQAKITRRLLDIDKTHFDASRKALIKSYAIKALGAYFAESGNQAKILDFVSRQLDSVSPKTRKLAKQFLKQWKAA